MPQKTKASPEYVKLFPDWPEVGPIDLALHDLPHKSSTTEWWYLHAHFDTNHNRHFSLFVSFFRHALSLDKKTGLYNYSHSVIWALSDLDQKKYYTKSLVDKDAPKIGLKHLSDPKSKKDPFMKKAAIEMLKKGVVPFPDELLKNTPGIPWDKLSLEYDDQTFIKNNDLTYTLHLCNKRDEIEIELVFTPNILPVRHGENGVIYNSSVEDMFYYFIPNCKVTGHLTLKNESLPIMTGTGWYDHEFGARPANKNSIVDKDDIAWNWIGIQLSDGYQLSIFDTHTRGEETGKTTCLILVDPSGSKIITRDFSFKPLSPRWTSTRTFNEYPTQWKIVSKDQNLELDISTAFENQEFATVISKPAFWEGRLNITGRHNNKKVTGKGYLERHGHIHADTITDFLKAVSKLTLQSVKKMIPLDLNDQKLNELVTSPDRPHFAKNIDKKLYSHQLIKPIRDIVDRGGKSWRSYAVVACCDAVGGNSQEAIDWLSMPELLHVGSLIIDDVQDKSSMRRGGPTAHKMYGESIAINSGCAAYFLGQICIYHGNQPDETKLKVYNWYFEAMRASHSGQALDITGLNHLMNDVIKSDTAAKKLPAQVLTIHRLKSAAPASYLARIGACLGKGSDAQQNALANYFESLGISFQIIDDVLNLKGFKENNKTKAEDLTSGKITYPVAVALSRMLSTERKKLYQIIQLRTKKKEILQKAINIISKYDALEISEKYARQNLEKAWKKLDPLIEDSMIKLNLRAFSWFVLERAY